MTDTGPTPARLTNSLTLGLRMARRPLFCCCCICLDRLDRRRIKRVLRIVRQVQRQAARVRAAQRNG
jgi:hypothetical protein